MSHSVENFMIFSVTPILREINLWDSRSGKYAILPHLEALNLELHYFLLFLEGLNLSYLIASKMEETAVLELLPSPKLISRKI